MEEARHRRRQSMPTVFPTPLTRAISADQLNSTPTQYPSGYGYSEPVTPPCSASQHQSVLFPNIKSQLQQPNSAMVGTPIFQLPEDMLATVPTPAGSTSDHGYAAPYAHGYSRSAVVAPYKGHTRSYSYSPDDVATAMGRVSIDGNALSSPFNNTLSSSAPSYRPRALSSGVFDFLETYDSWNRPLLQQPASSQAAMQAPMQPRPPLPTRSSQASLLSVSSASSSNVGNGHYLASPFSLSRSSTQIFSQPLSSSVGPIGQEANYNFPAPPQPMTSELHREPLQVNTSVGAPETSPTTPPRVDDADELGALSRENMNSFLKRRSSADSMSRGGKPMASPSTKTKSPIRQASNNSTNGSGSTAGKLQDKKQIESLSLSEIYALCRDQRGCRLLQRRLQENNPALVTKIFEATYKHMVSLMSDPFGNYFCQKLVEYCSESQLTSILEIIAPSMKATALNQHGTRALQRTIEVLKLPVQVQLVVNALDGSVVELIRDLNGNHVIQKILLEFDESGSQFIYNAVCRNIIDVGSHRHGCCVLQRCIDYASPTNRHLLVSNIVANTRTLVCDPFGNYVCQYVIALNTPEYTNALGEQMLGSIAELSVQKFSSNVVEKCLRAASPELAEKFVHELIQSRTLHTLLLDSYGNYVIQTALDSCDGESREMLVETVQTALKNTRSPYGRRIMSKLKE